MLAQHAHLDAKHWFAAVAEFASPADDAGIERHATADQRAGIGLLDHTRAIHAHDLRQGVGDAGAAVAHVKVDTIDGRGLHPDKDFARLALRHRLFADGDGFVATMAGEKGCLHGYGLKGGTAAFKVCSRTEFRAVEISGFSPRVSSASRRAGRAVPGCIASQLSATLGIRPSEPRLLSDRTSVL